MKSKILRILFIVYNISVVILLIKCFNLLGMIAAILFLLGQEGGME